MPQITLQARQVRELWKAHEASGGGGWYIAKDQGAYVGAGFGETGQVYYFRGCHPDHDEEWYDNARIAFGGDDFGEQLSEETLRELAKDPTLVKICIKVTDTQISINAWNRKVPA